MPLALGLSKEGGHSPAAEGMKRLRSNVGAIVLGTDAQETILSAGLTRSKTGNESTAIKCNEMDAVG